MADEQLAQMLQAFQQLANSVKDVGIGNSIKRAQTKVDEIRANQEMNDFEKIKAQQSLAKLAGAEVIRLGGNASMAQNAMASLAPEIPDARMSALESTGKGSIAEATKALQDEEEERIFKREERDFKRKKMLQDDAQAHAEKLAAMKAEGKAAGKPVPPAVSTKLSDLKDNLEQLKRLREGFAENAGAVGVLDQYKTDKLPALGGLNPVALTTNEAVYKKDAEDFFNQYRKVITGAAASMPELKGLLKAIPTTADRQDVYAGTLDMHIAKVEEAISNRLNLLEAQGRDVSDLREVLGVERQVRESKTPAADADGKPAPAAGQGLGKYITFKN